MAGQLQPPSHLRNCVLGCGVHQAVPLSEHLCVCACVRACAAPNVSMLDSRLAAWFRSMPAHSGAAAAFIVAPPAPPRPPACSGVSDQLLGVLITVQRFWKPSLINAVLPVVLVYALGMFVFFTGET